MIVGQIGNIQKLLRLIRREHHSTSRAAHPRPFGHPYLFFEIALLVGDVNSVAGPVGRIHQSVIGEVEGQMAYKLLGHWPVRSVGMVFTLRADLRQFVPVSAPAPLELELVQ